MEFDFAAANGLDVQTRSQPYSITGSLALAQRQFSLIASGTQSRPQTVYLDEGGLHPRGEDVLRLLQSQGFDVKLRAAGQFTQSRPIIGMA